MSSFSRERETVLPGTHKERPDGRQLLQEDSNTVYTRGQRTHRGSEAD